MIGRRLQAARPPLRYYAMHLRLENMPSDDPSGRARWVQWRYRRLVSAGFPARLADRLARQDEVDLHAVLELVDRGCPPALAARILAPLDEPLKRP